MKRNNFLLFISFLAFFLTNTGVVFSANEKPCNNVFNIFLNTNKEFWEVVSGGGGWKYIGDESSLIKETPKDISHGTTICTVIKSGIRTYAGAQICEDGTLKTIKIDGYNSNCSARTPMCKINNGQAECVGVGSNGCKSPGESIEFYYNNGKSGPDYFKGEYFAGGEKLCFTNGENQIVKFCNIITGDWDKDESIECPSGTSCINIKTGASNSYMNGTKCVDGCSDPPGQNKDAICGENNNSVLECNGMVWTKKTLKDYFKKDCYGCETLSDRSVHCQESASSLDGKCYRIMDGSNIKTVLPAIKNGLMCDGTILYKCDKQIERGFYDVVIDCSTRDDELKWCGNSTDDKTLRCVNEGDFNSMTINTYSNTKYMCTVKSTGDVGIDTAIGCIPITVNGLVEKLLPNIFGIAGGIAFLMMVYGFIMISTSSGDEKKAAEAKKIVTSAITGLLVAIFALFLYRLIAVDILQIPGIN